MKKFVYCFGNGEAEGDASQTELLGGKGANLAEMAQIGLPVPPGFTITTECCNQYLNSGGVYPDQLQEEVQAAMIMVEKIMDMKFGDPESPLLVSCRSGGRQSMPGMMETVLNVGLASSTIPGLIKKTGNERFVYDAYRRLIMMYSDVVMEKAEGIEPEDGHGVRAQLDRMLGAVKKARGYESDTDLSTEELKVLCEQFKLRVKETLGSEFPDTPEDQLWGAIGAVFKSWNGKRAKSYRRIENIPDDWGTAVTVQSMVFGNMGDTSGTGVAFTRNPATGENLFYGEWVPNAQGEDVVAGIRTPNPLNNETKNDQNDHLPSLSDAMGADVYGELDNVRDTLEKRYKDMLDIEFTIQDKKLFMLQCRVGKRTGTAALNMAMDMLEEGLIDKNTAIMRVKPLQLNELLHPIVDPEAEKTAVLITKGLPAGPGGAQGRIVFTSEDAVELTKQGRSAILVREETSPEDVEGMRAAKGILTARGGMTSHAALVARGWGKCCIVGAGALEINAKAKKLKVNGKTYVEGDIITLNGSRGLVYEDRIKMMDATKNPRLAAFMQMVDESRTMGVRANADTPEDARQAKEFGAEGIGLFRTEHMFYGANSEAPLFLLRKMILSENQKERESALEDLYPFVKSTIKNTLEEMNGMPVTIRLLDPPLHEFVPHMKDMQVELAKVLDIDLAEVRKRCDALQETNPMMGHRGVRLGITYPEITKMQLKAILESAAELINEGKNPIPEIMVPVTCDVKELNITKIIFDQIYPEVYANHGLKSINIKYGTMVETPRAALLGDKMAETAEFFSFGTNDLTQLTFGFSRDDTGGFMNDYLEKGIIGVDPFQSIDTSGVGELIKIAVERGRATRKDIKIGICGEQGGDPASVRFCYKAGLDYVSCSPFRVPIARLAAAQAAIMEAK
ncbi:pyruvate, phosphate dikinase [Desulforegula conservatrix]|uniref:pyruvate, phosphate dikinase n=1 Tax=Desulforegula conservatrix TaxID=153026 RepID=UPI0003F69EC2|nr:pyruvate, phosphate dikinase [Desulforegula conservatrix]